MPTVNVKLLRKQVLRAAVEKWQLISYFRVAFLLSQRHLSCTETFYMKMSFTSGKKAGEFLVNFIEFLLVLNFDEFSLRVNFNGN